MIETNLQSGKIFAVAAAFIAAICLAFFITGVVFDVLMVFGLSVVVASLFISVFADSAAKAKDYPAFMTFAAVVYMFISASAIKFIIMQNSGSRFFERLADLLIINSAAGSMIVLLLVFAFLYIAFINLLKSLNRETYFTAGQEQNFSEKLKFFASLPVSVSVLFIQAAVVVCAAVFASLLKQPQSEISRAGCFIGNFSLLVELPILLLLSSCGRVVNKIVGSNIQNTDRKAVIAKDINAVADAHFDSKPDKISFQIKDASWEDENSIKTIEFSSQDVDSPAGFEKIAETIRNFSPGAKVFLLTSNSGDGISVTLPVNIAIRLAHTGKKCLLADFDFKNCTVSQVFNIQNRTAAMRSIYPSPIKNLFIVPDFSRQQMLRAFELFKSTLDVILVYLPDDTGSADCRKLIEYTDVKMIF
ncbi:MAG: hypothetical protein ACYC3B_05435 [Sedimentisphaerales bacterium]